jgi:hypothetical protein
MWDFMCENLPAGAKSCQNWKKLENPKLSTFRYFINFEEVGKVRGCKLRIRRPGVRITLGASIKSRG